MTDDKEWIMRPALEGVCLYESLINGTLDLADVERMNEALSVRDENYHRVRDAQAAREG
jgi:hypothetical protein